jgi:hypothetical protein
LRSKSFTKEREGKTTIFVRALPEAAPDYDMIMKDIADHIRVE